MLEFFTKLDDNDALVLLRKDHDKVKGLFEEFEKTENTRQKKKIVADVIKELKIHAAIEEEIFYPALRGQKLDKELMNEADEEHHVAKLLIAELDQMDGSEDHWEAKFTVLSENIKHHIKEEEGEIFPKARNLDVDYVALGKKLQVRKQKLMKDGVPPSAEEKMMSKQKKGSNDSPAQNAKKFSASGKAVAKHLVKKPAVKAGAGRTKTAASKNGSAKKPVAKSKPLAKKSMPKNMAMKKSSAGKNTRRASR
jgi:hypothetical protein